MYVGYLKGEVKHVGDVRRVYVQFCNDCDCAHCSDSCSERGLFVFMCVCVCVYTWKKGKHVDDVRRVFEDFLPDSD